VVRSQLPTNEAISPTAYRQALSVMVGRPDGMTTGDMAAVRVRNPNIAIVTEMLEPFARKTAG